MLYFKNWGVKNLTISFYEIYTFSLYLEYIFRDKLDSDFQFNVFEDVRNKARMKYGYLAIQCSAISLHVLENKNFQLTCTYVVV